MAKDKRYEDTNPRPGDEGYWPKISSIDIKPSKPKPRSYFSDAVSLIGDYLSDAWGFIKEVVRNPDGDAYRMAHRRGKSGTKAIEDLTGLNDRSALLRIITEN